MATDVKMDKLKEDVRELYKNIWLIAKKRELDKIR